jgi:D-hexose-6-phosphate mutarotase
MFQEQLFVSKKSVFDGRKPIRGGIPVVFPQAGHHTHRICSIKRLSRENSKNIDDHKYGLCRE